MPTITIDGEKYQVDADTNLLAACIELGLELPYFCWHPALGSVGSCRQCAVKQYANEEDERGRMVMACMTPITDGMIISLKDQATQLFRDNCIEAIMANHPHDCPVCEEGGECHLQDMTNLSNHTVRYYDGKKRTFNNQNLGPFINHEMNRCITCYRCVRFYQDYAGGNDLQALGSSHHVYFGRYQDGKLESPFSGNLVEVCPTGVFTDRTFSEHYSRKWDLQTAPSICVHCSVGCNISPGERYGTLRRVVNRYHGDINGYFLCDRGRFGYDFVNHQNRIKSIFRKNTPAQQENSHSPLSQKELSEELAKLTQGRKKIGIGSPRASLEANFSLMQVVGQENFYAGVSRQEHQANRRVLEWLQDPPANIASLNQVKTADAILILGEDIINTAPILGLSVRQATQNKATELATQAHIPLWQAAAVKNLAQNQRSPLFIISGVTSELDEVATISYRATPDTIVKLGLAISHQIDPEAPEVTSLSAMETELVETIAKALTLAQRPLIVSGTACEDSDVIDTSANVARALFAKNNETLFSLALRETNSLGLTALVSDRGDADLETAVKATIESSHASVTAIILENDISQRLDAPIAQAFISSIDHLIVLDQLATPTVEIADLVLPTATFAESEGTVVNNEGRAQRYFPVFPPKGDVAASWKWLQSLLGTPNKHFDEVTQECANTISLLRQITAAAPDAQFRKSGRKVARQNHRYSGRGSMNSHISVNETQRTNDAETALSFSMEGLQYNIPPALQPDSWRPAWNSVESVNRNQIRPGGPLKDGNPGKRLFLNPEKPLSGPWPLSSSHFSTSERSTSEQSTSEQPKRHDQFQVISHYVIFGSDELSFYTARISQLAPEPVAVLNPLDAQQLGVSEHESVKLKTGDSELVLKVKINPSTPVKAVCIPRIPEVPLGYFNRLAALEKTTEKPIAKSNRIFFKGADNA